MHESTVAEENAIKINMDKPKTQSVQEKNVKIEDLDDVCFVSEVIAETNESRRTLRSGPSQKKNVPAEKKSESSAIGSDHKKTNDCDSPPPRQLRSDKGQQKSLEGKNNVPETKKRPSKSPKVDNKSTNKNKSVNVDEKYTEDPKKINRPKSAEEAGKS
ncbi:hypothetical protein JTB14_003011 [Gonioctena quinquepunctata]|nr:hypothetical protein JTB14_003011 [Gonioctena quinquepunctata]